MKFAWHIRRRFLVLAGLAVAVGLLAWFQYGVLSMSDVIRQEVRLRQWVTQHPAVAFAAGFAVYVLLSLIPGTPGKSFVFGWLYGFWQAVLMVDVALTVAAVITFLVSRHFLLEIVQARLAGLYHAIRAALAREGAFYLLMLRLVHAPYSLVNYAAGATGASTRTFWWTTQLGLLPGTIVCVLVGARLPSLAELQLHGFWSLVDPLLVAGLALTAVVPVITRWTLRRLRSSAPWRRSHRTESPV